MGLEEEAVKIIYLGFKDLDKHLRNVLSHKVEKWELADGIDTWTLYPLNYHIQKCMYLMVWIAEFFTH